MKNILFFIVCLAGILFLEARVSCANKSQESPQEKQPFESAEESSCLSFPLKAEIDPVTLSLVQSPIQRAQSMPVSLWVGGLSRLATSTAFLSSLPANIGILINPFEILMPEVLALISKQNRHWALIIPTRTRFDGENHSPETLNATKESQNYFEQVVIQTKIKTVFIPGMVDVDREVLEFIVALSKKHGMTLIIPPQFFSNLPELCQKQGVRYQLLDAFAPSNITFDDFKAVLLESVNIMKMNNALKIAILLTDEPKKTYLTEYIQLIQASHGLFVDEKPMMQAK